MESLTGGELNKLNGEYGISAPDKSVPIIKLIREHKPKSKEELVELIKQHSKIKCSCGIVSKGTIEHFGKNLYEAQIRKWGNYKHSLQECINWEYHLFVTQSLKGNTVEDKVKNNLSKLFNDLKFEDADNYYDEEMRIDLEIKKDNKTIAGIQIKPISYKFVRANVKSMNKYRNSLLDFPVIYVYYDYDTEQIIDFDDIIINIKKLMN